MVVSYCENQMNITAGNIGPKLLTLLHVIYRPMNIAAQG
jgi:hypothetical protein